MFFSREPQHGNFRFRYGVGRVLSRTQIFHGQAKKEKREREKVLKNLCDHVPNSHKKPVL